MEMEVKWFGQESSEHKKSSLRGCVQEMLVVLTSRAMNLHFRLILRY